MRGSIAKYSVVVTYTYFFYFNASWGVGMRTVGNSVKGFFLYDTVVHV